ncbi:uncharacterized protein [Euphorbia lathyris]|uniref:uncharacterized protein n=1 Tax=Euphorbia lathyris TaxID=212925 RepID=UPI003313FD7D
MEGRTRPVKSIELKPDTSQTRCHGHRRLKKKALKEKTVKRSPFLSAVQYAEHALACYENLNDSDLALACLMEPDISENRKFEVVQALGACRTLLRIRGMEMFGVCDRCHVSFIAKPRNSDGIDASPVLIFVELADWGTGELELSLFRKSQPDDPEITYGCGFCPSGKEYPHLEGYLGGLESVPVDAASQKEMARCFKHEPMNCTCKNKPKKQGE